MKLQLLASLNIFDFLFLMINLIIQPKKSRLKQNMGKEYLHDDFKFRFPKWFCYDVSELCRSTNKLL